MAHFRARIVESSKIKLWKHFHPPFSVVLLCCVMPRRATISNPAEEPCAKRKTFLCACLWRRFLIFYFSFFLLIDATPPPQSVAIVLVAWVAVSYPNFGEHTGTWADWAKPRVFRVAASLFTTACDLWEPCVVVVDVLTLWSLCCGCHVTIGLPSTPIAVDFGK